MWELCCNHKPWTWLPLASRHACTHLSILWKVAANILGAHINCLPNILWCNTLIYSMPQKYILEGLNFVYADVGCVPCSAIMLKIASTDFLIQMLNKLFEDVHMSSNLICKCIVTMKDSIVTNLNFTHT